MSTNVNFVPVEILLKNMMPLEQYVSRVVNYTSRYNNINSYFYAPINVIGKYSKYPSYGDFCEAYCLRTYGTWWKEEPAYNYDYMPQDFDPLGAEDYITLEFGAPVIPRDVCIYEIYNPGAIVRIWGKKEGNASSSWVLLWEGQPQKCPKKSRKFHPEIRRINCFMKIIRLEFNQSHLDYHCSIDAVLLGGLQPATDLQTNIIKAELVNSVYVLKNDLVSENVCDNFCAEEVGDSFRKLPYEVILHIFEYLDLKSLSRCAQVNKTWNQVANDPILYQSISFKHYWHLVDSTTLNQFVNRNITLKKLDLSWCGNSMPDFCDIVNLLLSTNSKSLTHLSLCECNIDKSVIDSVAECSELIDLRLRNALVWNSSSLHKLTKLIALDLTACCLSDDYIIKILKANPKLKHIVLDLCENLSDLDNIVATAAQFNKQLVTFSCWKTLSLTFEGVKLFKNCPNLENLDMGWCLLNTDPGDCLEYVADGCKNLRRLIISEWRGLHDSLLEPIIHSCKGLRQLDLLGIKNISADICHQALVFLPRLRFLEISFCDSIRHDQVEIWREQYPHITIQRSCQYVVNDYLN